MSWYAEVMSGTCPRADSVKVPNSKSPGPSNNSKECAELVGSSSAVAAPVVSPKERGGESGYDAKTYTLRF